MSRNILLIDAGNSTVKWAACVLDNGKGVLKNHANAPHIEFLKGNIAKVICGLSPQKVLVSNVAGKPFASQIINQIQRYSRAEIEFVVSERAACGVINGYQKPQSLGVDRWLGLIAARALTQRAVCVVDCGTAITLDVMDGSGRHHGGMILPGIRLMQEGLFKETADIASAWSEADRPTSLLGKNTRQAFECGLLHGISALIEKVRRTCRLDSEELECIVTGGDVSRLGLAENKGIRYVSDLVLRGLAEHEICRAFPRR